MKLSKNTIDRLINTANGAGMGLAIAWFLGVADTVAIGWAMALIAPGFIASFLELLPRFKNSSVEKQDA